MTVPSSRQVEWWVFDNIQESHGLLNPPSTFYSLTLTYWGNERHASMAKPVNKMGVSMKCITEDGFAAVNEWGPV